MVERDMQTLFGKYIKAHPPKISEIYELKICKGTSLRFDALQEHQVKALTDAQYRNFYYRITDQPWIKDRPYTFTKPKPFDCFILVRVESFVVIWFYKPREKKVFIKIPTGFFLKMKERCLRKSITEKMALSIGEKMYIN